MVKRYEMGVMESGSSGDYYPRLMESPKGDLIQYADHRAVVEEKDKAYHELMQQAIRFAEVIRQDRLNEWSDLLTVDSDDPAAEDMASKDPVFCEATRLLTSPEVQAWRKAQAGK